MGMIMRGRKCYTGKVKEQPVYSTDEMCIGTVDINGVEKKLYRKTYTGTIPSSGYNLYAVSLGVNIDYGTVMGGYINRSSGSHIPLNYYTDSTNYSLCWVTDSRNSSYPHKLIFNVSSSNSNQPFIVHIEYTKA